ncbi:peptidase family M1-domain-containing protein [Xylaria venustula]|nr:peptidase family M1-domain-containing protein [Xylaria venustula]
MEAARNSLPFIPLEYIITLQPYLDSSKFDGTLVLRVKFLQSTSFIQLDAIGLTIRNAKFNSFKESENDKSKIQIELSQGSITLLFPEPVKPGIEKSIFLSYEGNLRDDFIGFYRSRSVDLNGQTRWIAVTHLEPCNARYVFPCVDEPKYKAKFTSKIIAQRGMTCLSNMTIASKNDIGSGLELTTFNQTPPMSTYLFAAVVGHFQKLQSVIETPRIALYSPPSRQSQGSAALSIIEKGLPFFENLFECQYPLPKLDLIAVPDFAGGAMENWGLMTFRTSKLVCDPTFADVASKDRIADAVLHELSHQWIGNLVTMASWNHLWLKESFATLLAWYARDNLFTSNELWSHFILEVQQIALERDSLRASHPIESPVLGVNEIGQIFDDISYKKGCSVLFMLLRAIGSKAFFRGIKNYIRLYRFRSASSDDLWDAFSDCAGGSDLRQTLNIWTKEIGFPYVEVITSRDSHHGCKEDGYCETKVCLIQKRFLAMADPTESDDLTIYPLHISLRSKNGTEEFELHDRQVTYSRSEHTLFKVNADNVGFYRTLYTSDHLRHLGDALLEDWLNVSDRIGLLADATALSESGLQSTYDLLDLIAKMQRDTEYCVWQQIIKSMRTIKAAWMFKDTTMIGLTHFYRHLLSGKAKGLALGSFMDLGDSEIKFAKLILPAAAEAGMTIILRQARDILSSYKLGKDRALHPALISSMLGIVLANGAFEDVEYAFTLYKEFNTAGDENGKEAILQSLGYVIKPDLAEYVLRQIFTDQIRNQDICLVLYHFQRSKTGAICVWQWCQENWMFLQKTLSPKMISNLIPIILGGLSTDEHLTEVRNFYRHFDTQLYDHALAQACERIQIRQKWTERADEAVRDWLRLHEFM